MLNEGIIGPGSRPLDSTTKKGEDPMAAPSPDPSVLVADEDMVEFILKGDENAFEALFERYFSRIYTFVDRRMKNRADSEEVTQEAFVNLFLSLPSFRCETPFAAWLFGVTRRTVAARFEKEAGRDGGAQ
jgi:RNA polymerase sigma-70 factor (ECF subfamily)